MQIIKSVFYKAMLQKSTASIRKVGRMHVHGKGVCKYGTLFECLRLPRFIHVRCARIYTASATLI